jgi:hypothetical protein
MPLTDAQILARLEPPQGRVDLVLDTDTFNEIDDQFALVFAALLFLFFFLFLFFVLAAFFFVFSFPYTVFNFIQEVNLILQTESFFVVVVCEIELDLCDFE